MGIITVQVISIDLVRIELATKWRVQHIIRLVSVRYVPPICLLFARILNMEDLQLWNVQNAKVAYTVWSHSRVTLSIGTFGICNKETQVRCANAACKNIVCRSHIRLLCLGNWHVYYNTIMMYIQPVYYFQNHLTTFLPTCYKVIQIKHLPR